MTIPKSENKLLAKRNLKKKLRNEKRPDNYKMSKMDLFTFKLNYTDKAPKVIIIVPIRGRESQMKLIREFYSNSTVINNV